MAYPMPGQYRSALRSGMAVTYSVSAFLGSTPVDGAQGLAPLDGSSITDTTKPGVRRVLNLNLAGGQDMFETLAPIGTTLNVTARVSFGTQSVSVPMGVFDVDSQTLSVRDGKVSLTAPDRWVRVQRAKFVVPTSSAIGSPLVVNQIASLIRGAVGVWEPVRILSQSQVKTPPLVWEKDRDKAILDLAESAGLWVYCDREGVFTIADIPAVGAQADWLVDASATGVLIDLDRSRSRTDTRNVVVVSSSASDGEKFPTVYVWDSDVASPTYAGSNPVTDPQNAGPFGVATYFHDTPLDMDVSAAQATGRTILARTTGLASQVSLGQVPNPACDAFDVLDVLPPGQRAIGVQYLGGSGGFGLAPFGTAPFGLTPGSGSTPRVIYGRTSSLERHVADTVTHSLSADAPLRIEGRSTRTDYVGG